VPCLAQPTMFTSKLASTLTKAVAARSSTEMTAVAVAVAAAVTATTMTTANSDTSTEQHDSQLPSLLLSNRHQHHHPVSSQGFFPHRNNNIGNSVRAVSCEALLPQQATAVSSSGTSHRFSRLNRRRTIQRLQESKTKATLDSMYIVDKRPLGEGAFGAVFMGRHRQTMESVAVKKIPKQFTSDTNFQCEMEALLHIRASGGHPNICALRHNFEEGPYYYLVLDLVSGGEMFGK
jgi:Protein kinase domain